MIKLKYLFSEWLPCLQLFISSQKCFKRLLFKVKTRVILEKIVFLISLADTGGYQSDENSKLKLQEMGCIAFGEDITVGAAYGKCASLLGRVAGLLNLEFTFI